ncbi:hypothetical protein G6F59_015459 [Rhizopus arrhizus]|nr:hypothetical protein G6F59_015459 [Rhizopus arrhizus]
MRQFGQFGRNRGIALGLAPEQVFQATVRDHRGLRLREACLAQEPLKGGKCWHRTVGDASLDCVNSRLVIGGRGDDGDFSQVQVTRGAVDHRHAVQQETRGQRAQHEVLHGGFGGHDVGATQGDQRVQRQRHQFQAKVDRDQVPGGDHDHLAQQREERQDIEFTALEQVADLRIHAAVDQCGAHGDVGRDLQQVRHARPTRPSARRLLWSRLR